jgi:hypothetical protein
MYGVTDPLFRSAMNSLAITEVESTFWADPAGLREPQ